MIKIILMILLICVAIAYWPWALGLAAVWVVFIIWNHCVVTQPANSGTVLGYPMPGDVGNPDTNRELKQGYKQFVAANDPDIIDAFPCMELYPLESKDEPHDWGKRWVAVGGRLYAGRMIARKDSPVWTTLSRFSLPYPHSTTAPACGQRKSTGLKLKSWA
jgi:hypothetical protein